MDTEDNVVDKTPTLRSIIEDAGYINVGGGRFEKDNKAVEIDTDNRWTYLIDDKPIITGKKVQTLESFLKEN